MTYLMAKRKNKVVDIGVKRLNSRQVILEQVFRDHHEALCAFLRRRCLTSQEVEDVSQEIFARLLKTEDIERRLFPEVAAQRALLLTMANNYLVDLARHHGVKERYLTREREWVNADFRLPADNPEKIVSNRQDILKIKSVISGLRPSWRQAFVLSRYRYLTYSQISQEMGISVKVVEKYVRNALIQIREALEKSNGDRQ